VRQGSVSQVLASLPVGDRAVVAMALRSSFAASLNDLLYVSAGVALVGAVCALVLIRPRDFVRRDEGAPGQPGGPQADGPQPGSPRAGQDSAPARP
jgi:hypothetical protein